MRSMTNRPGFAQVGSRPVPSRSVDGMVAAPVGERRGDMPKLPRIYTRTGDDGTTGLVGGQRVKKNALRIESYGTIDELSSVIGLARTARAGVQRTRPVQDLARAHGVASDLDPCARGRED